MDGLRTVAALYGMGTPAMTTKIIHQILKKTKLFAKGRLREQAPLYYINVDSLLSFGKFLLNN